MKLYIAGPMRRQPEFNFPAFYGAELALKRLGYEVFNPARYDVQTLGFRYRGLTGHEDLDELGFPLELAVKRDLEVIREWADGVVVLPGWEESTGARNEVHLAASLDLPVRTLDEALRIGEERRDAWDALGELGFDCAEAVARSIASSYPGVEEGDVFQDAIVYLVTHPAEVQRQVDHGIERYGEERAEYGARRFVTSFLRQRMAQEVERAGARRHAEMLAALEAPRPEPVDLTRWGNRSTPPEYEGKGYTPAIIEAALPMLWDDSRAGQMEVATAPDQGMPKGSSNKAHAGTPWAIYADVRTAWRAAVRPEEAVALYLVYGLGLEQREAAELEGVDHTTIMRRVDRGLMRMADALNGTASSEESEAA